MNAAHGIPQPFSNLQLELLKLYARKVSDRDLLQIKTLLGQYFADKVWEEKKFTEEKILGKHQRTPYRREPV